MQLTFFEHPILNSPYVYPGRHWELDADGQPTNRLIESRRRSDLITPVPKAKKRKAPKGPTAQVELELTAADLHRELRADETEVAAQFDEEGAKLAQQAAVQIGLGMVGWQV